MLELPTRSPVVWQTTGTDEPVGPELLDFINWTAAELGPYPHGAITGRGEILVPPIEPGESGLI